VNLFGVTLQILILVGIGFGALGAFAYALRRAKKEDARSLADMRCFTPGELERLKGKGLLTEEEARAIQAVVADRTIDSLKKKEEPEASPPDLNALLAEAERLKRARLTAPKAGAKEEG